MKFCAKCTCARYCSSKCQAKDCKNAHRASCRQILWLRHAIFYFEQLEAFDEDVNFHHVEQDFAELEDTINRIEEILDKQKVE